MFEYEGLTTTTTTKEKLLEAINLCLIIRQKKMSQPMSTKSCRKSAASLQKEANGGDDEVERILKQKRKYLYEIFLEKLSEYYLISPSSISYEIENKAKTDACLKF